MSRNKRKLTADETIEILETGCYTNPGGVSVRLADTLDRMKAGTEIIRPDDFGEILQSVSNSESQCETNVEVFNETTFAGARALLESGVERVCCLNFASAKNPGGGFLGGSQAQEESLARASGLYASLQKALSYYEFHRQGGNALYSHHMIYSPEVPVFRDDIDRLIDEPWLASIITSPAVNAGALKKNSPELENQILSVMRERIDRVLALAASRGHKQIVLGAWGCGVFRNRPVEIADLFAESLAEGPAAKAFEQVRFSVLDRDKEPVTFEAFHKRCTR